MTRHPKSPRFTLKLERDPAAPEQVARARGYYETEDVQIDDDAVRSKAEGGVWVEAWVWLANDDVV